MARQFSTTGDIWTEGNLRPVDWCFDEYCTQIHLFEYCNIFMNTLTCDKGTKCNYMHVTKTEKILYLRGNQNIRNIIIPEAVRTRQISGICRRYRNGSCAATCKMLHLNEDDIFDAHCNIYCEPMVPIAMFIKCNHTICETCMSKLYVQPMSPHLPCFFTCPFCKAESEGYRILKGKDNQPIIKEMSCRDYVLYMECDRQKCDKTHDFLYCWTNCGSNRCKQLHLTKDETEEVELNRRPFVEKVQKEVDRLAYTYKCLYGEKKEMVCTRPLTGLNHCIQKCRKCEILEKPFSLAPRCCRCGIFGGDVFMPVCNHIYHEQCVNFLELDISKALPEITCLECGVVQLSVENKFYWSA